MDDLAKYFKIAEDISGDVSEFLLSNFGSLKEISQKSGNHYGIKEDLESNRMYEDYLSSETPEIALFTEEGQRNLDNDLVWVIDPIEGTSNYRAGNPFWCTQISLLKKGKPVFAIVNAPVLKQNFRAISGGGSSLNGNTISPSPLTDLSKALVEMGRGTKDIDKDWFTGTLTKISKRVRTTRSFGACGLGICYAACGITDAYLNFGGQIYDFIPGSFIAKEAGIQVLNLEGDEWKLGDKGVLVANSELAAGLSKLLYS
jgi:myo-inositol-1(or 4)-monophosphatase